MHINWTTRASIAFAILGLTAACSGSDAIELSSAKAQPLAAPVRSSAASASATKDPAAAARAAAAAKAKEVAAAKAKAEAAAKAHAAAVAKAKAKAIATAKSKAIAAAKAKAAAQARAAADAAAAASAAEIDVYYENCDAVRAAGAAPITVGDPGYSRKLDRDGDGVGCEN